MQHRDRLVLVAGADSSEAEAEAVWLSFESNLSRSTGTVNGPNVRRSHGARTGAQRGIIVPTLTKAVEPNHARSRNRSHVRGGIRLDCQADERSLPNDTG